MVDTEMVKILMCTSHSCLVVCWPSAFWHLLIKSQLVLTCSSANFHIILLCNLVRLPVIVSTCFLPPISDFYACLFSACGYTCSSQALIVNDPADLT